METAQQSERDLLKLITELLNIYPTAIRQNAVRMGLIGENDQQALNSQTLSKALKEWSVRTNATESQVESAFKELMSVDSAVASIARKVSGKGETTPQYQLSETMKYVVIVVLILGVFTAIVGIGGVIRKIFSSNS